MNLVGQGVERPGLGYPLTQQFDRNDDVTSDDAVPGGGRVVMSWR